MCAYSTKQFSKFAVTSFLTRSQPVITEIKPWLDIKIKYLLNKKKDIFRQYINNGKLHSENRRLQSITLPW